MLHVLYPWDAVQQAIAHLASDASFDARVVVRRGEFVFR